MRKMFRNASKETMQDVAEEPKQAVFNATYWSRKFEAYDRRLSKLEARLPGQEREYGATIRHRRKPDEAAVYRSCEHLLAEMLPSVLKTIPVVTERPDGEWEVGLKIRFL